MLIRLHARAREVTTLLRNCAPANQPGPLREGPGRREAGGAGTAMRVRPGTRSGWGPGREAGEAPGREAGGSRDAKGGRGREAEGPRTAKRGGRDREVGGPTALGGPALRESNVVVVATSTKDCHGRHNHDKRHRGRAGRCAFGWGSRVQHAPPPGD